MTRHCGRTGSPRGGAGLLGVAAGTGGKTAGHGEAGVVRTRWLPDGTGLVRGRRSTNGGVAAPG